MPLYDYACPICLMLREDVLEKASDSEIKECPVCKKNTLFRLAPINNFQIKGYSFENSYSNKKCN